jgi:Helix-turn-helix domain
MSAYESQNKAIIKHLRENGTITPREALDKYGSFRLAARIFELRKDGYNIITEYTDVGRRRIIGRYHLVKVTPRKKVA